MEECSPLENDLTVLLMGNHGLSSTSSCLTGPQFASSQDESKGKTNDGARNQHVNLIKCECDCLSLILESFGDVLFLQLLLSDYLG